MTARSPLTQELTDFLLKSIQKLAKRDPEKFVTCLLGQVAQMDRAAYDWIMTDVMTRTFDECGFNESLGRLKRNLEQNNVPAALEIVHAIEMWVETIRQMGSWETVEAIANEQKPMLYVM